MSYTPPQYPQEPWQGPPPQDPGPAGQPGGPGPQPYSAGPQPDAGGPQFAAGAGEPPLTEAWYDADFKQSISRFVQKAAHFQGYASRAEYWWAVLAGFLLNTAFSAVLRLLGDGALETLIAGVFSVASLLLVVPGLAVASRRLHDAGFSALLLLLLLLPFLGWIALIVLLALPTNLAARRMEWADANPTPTINWIWR